MMKLLTVLFFFISFISWTQEDEELVLYRGIENRVYLKDLSENERVVVTDSSILVKQINDSIYLSIPALFPLNTLRIQVVDQHTNALKMEQEVPVVFIPDPDLELLTRRSGCGGNPVIKAWIQLNPEFKVEFEVLSYTIETNYRKANGIGKTLNFYSIHVLKLISVGDLFLIHAKVKGPDGIIREVKNQYKF